jgi:hypothetical protein
MGFPGRQRRNAPGVPLTAFRRLAAAAQGRDRRAGHLETAHIAGAPTPASQQTGIPFETPSVGFYLNLPVLSSDDGQTGAFWLGAAPAWALENTSWRGAVIYRSGDGITFTDYVAVTTATGWGKAQSILRAYARWGV